MPLIACDLAPMTHLETGVLSGFLVAAMAHPTWTVAVSAWNEVPAHGPTPDLWLIRGHRRPPGRSSRVVRIGDSSSDPAVWLDDRACGAMAAQHLLASGFRTIAYRGDPGIVCSGERARGAADATAEAGAAFIDLPPSQSLRRRWSIAAEAADHRAALARCPRPLGLVAFTVHVGRRVLAATEPDEVPNALGVVACDHDPVVAAACRPSLACVSTPAEAIGRAAADLVAEVLAGRTIAAARRLIPPSAVSSGGSAAGSAVADPLVIAALDAIRADPMRSVLDLAGALGVARRTLEVRCAAALGSSPGQLMRRRRIGRALELLRATDLPASAVATACGWASATRFTADIRTATGMPPQAWRRHSRSATTG